MQMPTGTGARYQVRVRVGRMGGRADRASGSPGTGNVATFSSLWRSRTALDPTVELPAVLVTGSYLYFGREANQASTRPSQWHHVQTPGVLHSLPDSEPRSPSYHNLFRPFPSSPHTPQTWSESSPGSSIITCKYSNSSIDDIIRYKHALQ
jgi:hypothetical protein